MKPLETNCPEETAARDKCSKRRVILQLPVIAVLVAPLCALTSCEKVRAKNDTAALPIVGITKVTRQTLRRQITLSSELVPFQEIAVYAKESGYVQKLLVDYGSRVKQGQLMAVLEIPELQAQLAEDQAAIKNASDEVTRAAHMLKRYQATYKVLNLEYNRLHGVFDGQPGLVAQQEVDDAQGKSLAAASQVDASESALAAAESKLLESQSKLVHDQALYQYSQITAPFAGVVTERYANLGTLMQAGTSSSTQVLPLVRLSQDDLFRLVIPVPESDVRYIRTGDPVNVRVPALNRTFPGKVARFSADVREDTRTMHTEVDIPNPGRALMPGLYAEATLTLESRQNVLAVPIQAVDHQSEQSTVDIVGATDRLEQRKVKLGLQTATAGEVLSGLNEGEIVIVSDRSGLKEGQPVRPQPIQLPEYESSAPE